MTNSQESPFDRGGLILHPTQLGSSDGRDAAVQVISTEEEGLQSLLFCACAGGKASLILLLLWACYKIVSYKSVCEF